MTEAPRMERTMLLDWLQDDRLSRRTVAGLTLGLACMYLTWTIGYFLLPEGMLRGKTGAGFVSGLLPERTSVFLLALIWNASVAFIVTPLVGVLAIGRLSLAYALAAGNFALYGVFLGTNSFSTPRPEPLPPSLSVFMGTGPWEIGAYMLVAATIANRYRFRQEHWLIGKTTRVTRRGEKMSIAQWATLVVAVIVIIVTAWIEDVRSTRQASERVALVGSADGGALTISDGSGSMLLAGQGRINAMLPTPEDEP